jgi:hypothetical protein
MSDRLAFDALEDLGQQLSRLERRAAGPSAPTRRRVPTVAIVVAAIFAGSTSLAIAAATGVFDRQPDGLIRRSVPQTIAKGDDPLFGRWSAVTYESDHGLCLDVTVEHNIADESMMSGSCGGGHGFAQDGGGPTVPKAFFYGLAPYAATKVRLEIKGESPMTIATHRVSPDVGAFYFASVERNVDNAQVVPLSASSDPVGPALSAP